MRLIVLDTNILLHADFKLDEVREQIIVPITVVEELDGLKKGKGDTAFRARRAIRELRQRDNVEYLLDDYTNLIPLGWDKTKPDNKILAAAIHKQCPVLTNDFNLQIKAKAVGLEVKEFKTDYKQPRGIKEVNLDLSNPDDKETLAHVYENPEDNIYDLQPNQYLVLYQVDKDFNPSIDELKVIDIFKWCAEEQAMRRLEYRKVANGITGKAEPRNVQQRILFDLMQDEKVPIKMALGKFGTGGFTAA